MTAGFFIRGERLEFLPCPGFGPVGHSAAPGNGGKDFGGEEDRDKNDCEYSPRKRAENHSGNGSLRSLNPGVYPGGKDSDREEN